MPRRVRLAEFCLIGAFLAVAFWPFEYIVSEPVDGRWGLALYFVFALFVVAALRPLEIDHRLRAAIWGVRLWAATKQGHVELHYQPKLNVQTGEVRSVEALVRWTHPAHGPVAPCEFMSYVEQSWFVKPFNRYVLRRALQNASAWLLAGRPLCVAVNVPPKCLGDEAFPEEVIALLRECKVPPQLVLLEVTEQASFEDAELQQNMAVLRAVGVSFALDDFGAANSSMARLVQLRIDEIKIDGGFVRQMLVDERAASVVHASIRLAHALGASATAESVETPEILDSVRAMGCEVVQGYAVARPRPVDQLEREIERATQLGAALTAST